MISPSTTQSRIDRRRWLYGFLLVIILLIGAYLRLVGLDWDEDQHLHPDERFLTMVEASISPVSSIGEYFDTENSSLNPHNRGHGFFVYGTLPIFIVRYVAEWLGDAGYGQVYLVGRALSALVDLFTVLLVYLVAARLYDRRVGILAAAFSAFTVLQIQQSHFFTVDTFINFFTFLSIYFAVEIITSNAERPKKEGGEEHWREGTDEPGYAKNYPQYDTRNTQSDIRNTQSDIRNTQFTLSLPPRLSDFISHPIFRASILFGLALGMAVASKINALPVAVILPAAVLLKWWTLPPKERNQRWAQFATYVVLAALVSILTFRIFQPYAFSGPGFFGVTPNEKWVANIKSLAAQTSGDVDFPPAMQWARRPIWFSFQNLTIWGLGLPLGILAWIGFGWMGWRMIKTRKKLSGEIQRHALLWGWTALYFTWQSMIWNSTMRYQLPIYPALAVLAAWAVIRLWDRGKSAYVLRNKQQAISSTPYVSQFPHHVFRFSAVVIGFTVLVATFAWAFAFTRIYTRPHPRVEATRWIIQNFPGPITLPIQTEDGPYNQPLHFPKGVTIQNGIPYHTNFVAREGGVLEGIYLPHVVDTKAVGNLLITISASTNKESPLSITNLPSGMIPDGGEGGEGDFVLNLNKSVALIEGQTYHLTLEITEGLREVEVCDSITLYIQSDMDILEQNLSSPADCIIRPYRPLSLSFSSIADGTIEVIALGNFVVRQTIVPEQKRLILELSRDPNGEPLALGEVNADFLPGEDKRGEDHWVALDHAITLAQGETYYLKFDLLKGEGAIVLTGTSPANESTWDDGLPLRMDGYDPYGGIYRGSLNFEMYWDDNADKLARFNDTLAQAEYVLITSSRQWGSLPRIPERFPLVSEYYRRLLGCPAEESIEWCYNVAQPGTFQEELGFELVKVFQSNPTLGPWEINDQFAEEAFTVYDHTKVFIFRKSPDYDPEQVETILGAVDLSNVLHVTPRQADRSTSEPPRQEVLNNLMLPPERLSEQREGGTWSELFNPDGLQNKYQVFTVALWYLSVGLIGLLVYPLVRFAMPGLSDGGYPFARIAGMLLLSNMVWLAGSARIPFDRLTIGIVLLLIAILCGYLAYRQREELRQEWQERRRYFLMVEGIALAIFIIGLLYRLGNPDLWHPWKGGEKPMDFSYLNAVLKSTSFPPFDPWFSGGYINYYYYGFVIVGVLVKFLGIVPAIAYNLILPTLLTLIALGAFSIVWNLTHKIQKQSGESDPAPQKWRLKPYLIGLAGAASMAFIGNLGTLQMIFRGFQQLASNGADLDTTFFLTRWWWTFEGILKALSGSSLSYRLDEWYWNPSRVIPGESITEFPFFTFLYGDLHAHLIALPIALLVLGWVLSVVLGRAWGRTQAGPVTRRSPLQVVLGLFLGGLAIGALYPVNLSDIYTYLPLGIVALVYAIWRYKVSRSNHAANITTDGTETKSDTASLARRLFFVVGAVIALVLLSQLLYQPYSQWYAQGYSKARIWDGTRTPLSAYITHWGLFLFVIVSWMTYETIRWMANTPVTALRELRKYRELIFGGLILLVISMIVLGVGGNENLETSKLPIFIGVQVVWLVLPLAAWAGVLLIRPDMPDTKRIVLFFIGTGLVLTLMVEIIVVSGDIGRMNTVFKFYLQTWTLFAVSAAAAFGWMVGAMPRWSLRLRTVWQIMLALLFASAALYPLLGGIARIKDRMSADAPNTLDGMAYMLYSTYHDLDTAMDLSQDYNAIRWLQDNVKGSPVIVEANMVEYHWGSRITINTGLPSVLGWNWHQRQQRTLTPHEWIWGRLAEIEDFYLTTDQNQAKEFLAQYEVSYIILGQLERAKYPGPGLDKFPSGEGILWREVFRDRETVIYEVIY